MNRRAVETVFGWSSVVVSLPLLFERRDFFLKKERREDKNTLSSQQQQQCSDNSLRSSRIERDFCACVCARVCVLNTRVDDDFFEDRAREFRVSNLFSEKIDPLVLLSSFVSSGGGEFFFQHEGDEKRGMNLHFFTKNCKEDSREKSERD